MKVKSDITIMITIRIRSNQSMTLSCPSSFCMPYIHNNAQVVVNLGVWFTATEVPAEV